MLGVVKSLELRDVRVAVGDGIGVSFDVDGDGCDGGCSALAVLISFRRKDVQVLTCCAISASSFCVISANLT